MGKEENKKQITKKGETNQNLRLFLNILSLQVVSVCHECKVFLTLWISSDIRSNDYLKVEFILLLQRSICMSVCTYVFVNLNFSGFIL